MLPYEVVRSPRRRRTVGARLRGGVVVVTVPAGMSEEEEQRHARSLVARLERRLARSTVDASDGTLEQRAERIAERYGLPRPTSIRWVSNQAQRWGSCGPTSGSIRISDRMVGMPAWVVDTVIHHELVHLVVPHHGPAFRALLGEDPDVERAEAFLAGVAFAEDRLSR